MCCVVCVDVCVLQGTNLLMTFGMSIVLSFWAPTLQVVWSSYLAHMLLVSTGCRVRGGNLCSVPGFWPLVCFERVCCHIACML